MEGNGVKIPTINNNLKIDSSILKYSPKPLQTPAISEFLCLYNFFIISKKDGQRLVGDFLRSALPFTAADSYTNLTTIR